MGRTGEFTVDLPVLGELVTRLRRLRAELSDATGCQTLDDTETGSPVVTRALSEFVARWDDGRARIHDNLDTCAADLEATIAQYQALDAAGAATFGRGSDQAQ